MLTFRRAGFPEHSEGIRKKEEEEKKTKDRINYLGWINKNGMNYASHPSREADGEHPTGTQDYKRDLIAWLLFPCSMCRDLGTCRM